MSVLRPLIDLVWLLAVMVALPAGVGAALVALATNAVAEGPLALDLFVEPLALLVVGGGLAWWAARRFPTPELRDPAPSASRWGAARAERSS